VVGYDRESLVGVVKPSAGTWQDAHDKLPSPDNLLSKNSILPNFIFSLVCGLFLGIGTGFKIKLFKLTAYTFLAAIIIQKT
jgi:hypothetical protein